MRVAVVDDSRTERMYLRRVLRDAGHEVVGEAENGEDAIQLCEQMRPDVVLMDVAMRGMHGDVAARLIAAAGTARHIIIISSNIGFLRAQYIAEGFWCINKPHTNGQILAAIEGVTRGESLARSRSASQ